MIKKGNPFKKEIDPKTRVQLIRKGNELFSKGEINLAEKIFITIDYKDGLVRLGDYYFKNKNLYKCAEMYFMSENKAKINSFCKKSAIILSKWLKEDEDNKTYDKILFNKERIEKNGE